MNKVVVLKPNNEFQRADATIDLEIACALREIILSGQNIYDPTGTLTYTTVDNEGNEISRELKVNTLRSWIRRRNVVPETGEVLKDILDRAREEYRTQKEEKRRAKLINDAEREINRTLNLKSNVPAIGMFGVIRDPETKKVVRKENTNILKIKMNTAKFVTERLAPEKWQKIEKSENKHLVAFSLADLRKAERGEQEVITK